MTQLNFKYILWILIFFFTFILFNSWENEKYLNKELDKKEAKHHVQKIWILQMICKVMMIKKLL